MTEAKRLIVLRHGETAHNASGIYQGHLDTDLSMLGRAQAAAAARALAPLAPQRIVASDLQRAAHTAAALGELVSRSVEHDARLREIDVGAWAGLSHTEVLAGYPQESEAIADGHDARRGDHGETVQEVTARTHAAAGEIAEALDAGQVGVLVTHGLAARTLVNSMLGWSYRDAWLTMAGLRNCHWAELAQHRTGWRLISWNAGAPAAAESSLPGNPVTH